MAGVEHRPYCLQVGLELHLLKPAENGRLDRVGSTGDRAPSGARLNLRNISRRCPAFRDPPSSRPYAPAGRRLMGSERHNSRGQVTGGNSPASRLQLASSVQC